MLTALQPHETLEERDVRKGMRMLLYDGVFSQTMGSLVTGAFLVAFALMLGASNSVVGVLAAIGPLTQILQIPAIFLVNRMRRRKLLTVAAALLSRLCLIPVALTPWLAAPQWQMPLFLGSLFVFFALGAVAGCSFNSWIRDLIPDQVMGTFFARRMAWSIGAGAVLSLAAGLGLDLYQRRVDDGPFAYAALFLAGTGAGLMALYFLVRTPEPRMTPPPPGHLFQTLAAPFRDHNFRSLLIFLGSWNFAVNIAAPFGTVYMLNRLGLSIGWVLVFGVFGQFVHVVFLHIWGALADRLTNKSVLSISGPLFILSFLIWPFTTMPEAHWLTLPLLVFIHALGGMSTAGVVLAAGNIALKAAPYGRATAYLAVNALVCGCAATVAPILAGMTADLALLQELSVTLRFGAVEDSVGGFSVVALSLRGLDFLFVISFILGLYALHRLMAVHEEGAVEERVALQELFNEMRRVGRSVSNIAGMRHLSHFPYYLLSFVGEGMRRGREQRRTHEVYRPPNPWHSL